MCWVRARSENGRGKKTEMPKENDAGGSGVGGRGGGSGTAAVAMRKEVVLVKTP